VVQRYSRLVFRRSQAAKTLENSTFFIQLFALFVYIPGVTQKAGAASRQSTASRAPLFLGLFLTPFPRVLIE